MWRERCQDLGHSIHSDIQTNWAPVRANNRRILLCSIKLFVMLRELSELHLRVLKLTIRISQLYLDALTLRGQGASPRIKRT